MKLYTALLHYPVYNKNREIIVTSIVIHDIHDMARAGKTFGAKNLYIVQPFEKERAIVGRIKKFWETTGKKYNPNRNKAIEIVKLSESFEETIADIAETEGEKPIIIGTSAQEKDARMISYDETRNFLKKDIPALIVFGTGWGLAGEALKKIDFFLPSIKGVGIFNHLSVRSAFSIVLYRLSTAL